MSFKPTHPTLHALLGIDFLTQSMVPTKAVLRRLKSSTLVCKDHPLPVCVWVSEFSRSLVLACSSCKHLPGSLF